MPAPAPILSTPRLTLRELTADDLDYVAQLRGDPEVMRFYPKVLDRAESLALIERMQKRYAEDGFGLWLVSDRETQEPRGLVGVVRQHVEGADVIEVGYMIDRHYWRQGLASEAASACFDWAFQNLEVDSVCSLIRPVNLPSQGVARKLGLTPLPDLVQHFDLPHHVFRISRSDWQCRQK
ncbi:GNAT family N-acetyltransferase [Planctomicrobium sp. SH661]|uniref:GNAT family N-acetyltransferase n=1 Tax=Planctomicrobium sp. SH661 TaxID=3448124 RepID=UPI003F5B7B27